MSYSTLVKLKLSPDRVESMLAEYKAKCPTPTYRGFLRYLGLGTKEFNEMVAYASNPNNRNWVKIMTILDNFKLDMEVKMEEYMLYQLRHPDLKNMSTYRFDLLDKLLKYSSPSYYGDKRVALANQAIGNGESKEQELIKLLENKSEVKW